MRWVWGAGLALSLGCDDAAPGAAADGGEVCLGAACRDAGGTACRENRDCPPGFGCDPARWQCVPEARPCADRSGCLLGEVCLDGVCVLPTGAGDAGVADGGSPDGSRPDAAPLDAAVPDALLDAALPDARLDAALRDGALADMAMDAQAADAAWVDARPPDAAWLDAEAPDAALPDADLPDAAPDAAPEDAAVPLGPVPRGVYQYTRLPVGGLTELQRVAFHPSGDYAVALAYSGGGWVVDWQTGEATPFALPAGDPVYWTDLAFLPGGDRAVLTGYRFGEPDVGFVAELSDGAWRAGEGPVVTESLDTRVPGERLTAVDLSPDGVPVVLASRRVGGGYNAVLRRYALDTGGWLPGIAATVTSAGCGDLAHVRDEFGGVGVVVTCGENGADLHLYRTLGGVAEWVARPGVGNIGNLGGIAAHPSLDYALIISTSGRRVHRFEGGRLLPSNTAPNYSRQGIAQVAFQDDGRRALVVGRAGVQPVRGTVIEYRHDLYRCPNVANDCELTEVSIPGFDGPPYNAESTHRINDAAFRPGCDGGLLVGGYSAFRVNVGYLIRFQIDNGRACP